MICVYNSTGMCMYNSRSFRGILFNKIYQICGQKMSLKVLLFVSLMGMTQVVNGQGIIQLQECTSYINDTNQCMTEYPVVSGDNPLLILNPISRDASIVCSNKSEYVSLITCFRDAITKCLSAEFNSIYPSAEAYVANYMYFCQNSENFHINCSLEISLELLGCLRKNFNLTDLPTFDDGFYKWQDHICRAQDVSNDCLLETKTSESCRSTFEMMKEMSRILVPPVCSNFTTDNPNVKVTTESPNVQVTTDNPNVQVTTDNASVQDTTENPNIRDTTDNPNLQVTTNNASDQDTTDNPNIQDTTDNPNVQVTTDNASVKLNNDNLILFMVCLLIGVIRHGIYIPI
ncbi:hypothetical protein SNE40_003993 [Patella caerulea]|uniref:DUF19 domain-containing protein n=2 Tax=Patella caerulea TaxID=87958 RepID=A0AAN8Q0V3_PATCE